MSDNTEKQLEALKKLRAPFPPEEISRLPKPTANQTAELKQNVKCSIRCKECGGWHHKDVVHLDYVGHAAVTNRLLDVDPLWDWDFLNKDQNGAPILDANNAMWITLTVCGMTRKGYGDASGKRGADAMKEIIGDAIRNAAMRFGVALKLWHKGEFASDDAETPTEEQKLPKQKITDQRLQAAIKKINDGEFTVSKLSETFELTDEQYDLVMDGVTDKESFK